MLILIPTILSESGFDAIPPYVVEAVKTCHCFFVEDERTARRYLKKLWPEMVIDQYRWYRIDPADHTQRKTLLQELGEGQTVGILSEAGCPGIADPGAELVGWAQEAGFPIRPLVGPSSILLALMASGFNGQQFAFHGYLPVKDPERSTRIRELEAEARRKKQTQIFIETPYRNNQLIDALLQGLQPETRLCVAVDITGAAESIRTRTIAAWKKERPAPGKVPAIFLIGI